MAQLAQQVAAHEPPPPDPHAFHFALPEETPAFDAADWKDLAGHLLELSKLLDTVREEVVTNRGEPRSQTQTLILKHNQPLSLFAISILDEMGEGNPSAAYTHPSVLANLIRAALDLAGEPLSRAQEVAIRTMGEAWQAEAAPLERPLPPDVPVLARTIAEVDAKLRFVRAVKDVLTDRQRAVLFHPGTEERVQVDLLSAALVHNGVRSPVDANDRAELERALVTTLLSLAGIEDEDPAPYAWIGRRWLDEIPEVLVPHHPWEVDVVFTPVDALQAQARAQVRAIEGIVGHRPARRRRGGAAPPGRDPAPAPHPSRPPRSRAARAGGARRGLTVPDPTPAGCLLRKPSSRSPPPGRSPVMNLRTLLVSFVVGAVVAGGVTWLVLRRGGGDGETHAAPSATDDAARRPATLQPGADVGVSTEELLALESENRELEGEVARLEARLLELKPPPLDPDAFRFGLAAKTPAFDKADWPVLVGHAAELTKLLAELRERILDGRDVDAGFQQRLVKHNTPLALFAVAFGAEMEDTTPNGAYTHPPSSPT